MDQINIQSLFQRMADKWAETLHGGELESLEMSNKSMKLRAVDSTGVGTIFTIELLPIITMSHKGEDWILDLVTVINSNDVHTTVSARAGARNF